MISHNANKNAGDSCPCQKFESKYMTLPNCLLFFRSSKMSWQARWHCKVRLKSIQSCLSLGKFRFTKVEKIINICTLLPKKPLQYFIHLHYSSICKTQCTLTRNVNWDDELDGVTGKTSKWVNISSGSWWPLFSSEKGGIYFMLGRRKKIFKALFGCWKYLG